MKKDQLLKYITVTYVVLLIMSNIMAQRLIAIGPWTLDAGNIAYPLLFMLGDLMTELYGYKESKKIILTGFAFNFLFVLLTWVGAFLPRFDQSSLTIGYDVLFNYSPRIVLVSFVCYLLGTLLNSASMIWIKKATGQKWFAVRTIGSTALGALIDTGLFSILAWVGQLAWKDIIAMIVITYIAKMLYECLIATPAAYALRGVIQKLQ